jgi:hypothetical protein
VPLAWKVHTVEELLTGGPEQPQATKPFQVPTMLVAFDIYVSHFQFKFPSLQNAVLIFDEFAATARWLPSRKNEPI